MTTRAPSPTDDARLTEIEKRARNWIGASQRDTAIGEEILAWECIDLLAALRAAWADLERSRVQLAGCGVAANDGSKEQETKVGDYGWSASYADVLALRRKHEAAEAREQAAHERADAAAALATGQCERADALERALRQFVWVMDQKLFMPDLLIEAAQKARAALASPPSPTQDLEETK